MNIIILEVPHQRSPSVWVARDEQHLIEIAQLEHNLVYDKYTMEKAEYYMADEIPDDLLAILNEHGEAVQVGHSGDSEFFSIAEAGTEIEAAKEAIGHDLSNCHFLSVAEAKEFKGHADAEIALNKYIEDNDYLFGGDE
tara:strand:- start:81 stop:497 length:417 start_codon:yes stop_codon:yes gene_type:complete